jgi:hypothetical protein
LKELPSPIKNLASSENSLLGNWKAPDAYRLNRKIDLIIELTHLPFFLLPSICHNHLCWPHRHTHTSFPISLTYSSCFWNISPQLLCWWHSIIL